MVTSGGKIYVSSIKLIFFYTAIFQPVGIMSKRVNFLPWEDYFMSVAFLSGMRSKDPSSQVGACIVNSDNIIVSIGYNGMRGV
ncbi:hypothetical protein Avbf_10040 [Armadillidium vulgare]|nr:hypothetical protein Avbf_10040 [Armadillidium vulgare]